MAEASLVLWKDWWGWLRGVRQCLAFWSYGRIGGRVAGSEECGSVLHLASAHSSQRI